MRRKTRGSIGIALAAALSLGIAACGGDDGDSSSTPETEAPSDGGDTGGGDTGGGEKFSLANFTAWEDLPADAGGLAESPVIDCAPDDGPLKAAWVYVGPINDGGWTQAHNESREAAQAHFGDAIETTYKENVPEGPQVLQVIDDLIADGNTYIIGTSFGFQDAFAEAAANNPDICFEFATGFLSAPNLSQFYGSAEDTDYLTGMAAGAASETGKLGIIAAFPIPEVVRGVNAWTLGARATNPDAEVTLLWTNTWFDPALERKSAEQLIADGADVIGVKSQDSPASGDAAAAAGVPWAGYDSDQSQNYPEVWLTATTYHWDVYHIPRIQAALDGKWIAGNYYGALNDEFVKLAPYGKIVAQETIDAIEVKKAEFAEKPGSMFCGPIVDNKGTEQLAAGVCHTFGELMSMMYLVEGVNGEIPAS